MPLRLLATAFRRAPRPRARPRFWWLAAAVLLSLHGAAGAAAAQPSCTEDPCGGVGDEVAPTISFSPASGTYSQPSIPVQVSFGDGYSLDENSLIIKLNGLSVTSSFQYTQTSTSPLVRAVARGTIVLGAGTNTLIVTIADLSGNHTTTTATYRFGVPGVSVGPDGGAAAWAIGNQPTQTFTVGNTGPDTASFLLQATCRNVDTGDVVQCSAPASTSTIAAGGSQAVTVSYPLVAAGQQMSVQLRARHRTAPAVGDAGWVDVDVHHSGSYPQAMGVALVDLNSTGQISRGECVTVSVGVGAAYECGDLRLAHGVPGMATLGRARAPVLLYNSQHGSPKATVYADLTLTGSTPEQVVVTVTTAGAVHTRTYPGSEWWNLMTRRVGVQWDARLDESWLIGFTLQVTAVYPNGVQHNSAPVNGELAMVNRLKSHFGSGWWLAGLEQISCLCANGGTRRMLRFGDGSTRILQQAVPGQMWVGQNPDGRPDTLWLASSPTGPRYTRKLAGGGEIHFDSLGRHVRTVSRLNDTTHFTYEGLTQKLTYVSVPARDGVARGFRFTYTGTYLTAVNPEINGTSYPGITLTRDGGRTLAITDPDGLSTQFGFADAANVYRITSRQSRDTTLVTYGYDAVGKLSSATLALSNTENIVTSFTAAESRGVSPTGTTVPTALVGRAYTLIDGPRTDVVDQTRIWVTNRGAPRRIRDAMGGETVLERTNTTYPSLVTQVRGTNAAGDSLVVRSSATYDGRGRVLTSTAVNPLGNGQNLTTTYAYDDRWDAPTSITAPGVGPTQMAYDTLTGNVLWQQQGSSTRRVYFDYHASGPHRGLLAQVRHPHPVTGVAGGGGADSLGYDLVGNLRFTRTPRPQAFLTYHYRDHFGRDTLTLTPVRPDSADTEAELKANGARTRTIYDTMGRVRRTESIGKAVNLPGSNRVAARTAPAEMVRVETDFDAMGRPRQVSRWSTPDSAGVGMLTTYFRHDRAGRKVTENSLATGRDSTAYDPAGNAVAVVTARGHTITMAYDALGRLVRRSVPAATDNQSCVPGGDCSNLQFPYYPSNSSGGFTAPTENFYYRFDAAGNQVYAENMDAQVIRSYHPGGALRGDTTRMRSYAGMDFTHVFGLEYHYDAFGRLRALQHPTSLTGTAQADSFAYSDTTGALTQTRSRQGYLYGFEYDLLGRPVRTDYPGAGAERTTYDEQGRRLTRVDSIAGGVLAQDAYTYDARGKMTLVSGSVGSEQTEFHNWYSGLGNLLGTDWGDPLNTERTTEVYTVDGMGNQARSTTWSDGNASPPTARNVYMAGTGRIRSIGRILSAQPGETPEPDSTYRHYDQAGNVTWGEYKGWGAYFNGAVDINHITLSRNYYSADQKLREVQVDDRTTTGTTWSGSGSFTEYRYDALGRRIMERTRRDAAVCYNNGDNCQSTLTRFVWAGDQLLWELRVPGGSDVPATSTGLDATSATGDFYGRVSYFHAGGIDRPLLITKEGAESVVPRETWRGQFHAGTSPSTGAVRDCPIGVQTNCLQVNWPGMRTNASHSWGGEQPDIRVWYGGLVDGMRDASGQMYMRNRYYDPATGQFTQTDPIGIAGGMNAYGFAAGDPVTYADPYGLEAEEIGQQCRNRLSCLITAARGASTAFRTWRATRRARGAVDDLVDAARRSGRTAARLDVPARPNGMTPNDFGTRVMRWGTGNSEARDRIGSVTREELQEAGVTHQMAREWRDFYVNEVLRNPNNPSARGRAELMYRAAELLQ